MRFLLLFVLFYTAHCKLPALYKPVNSSRERTSLIPSFEVPDREACELACNCARNDASGQDCSPYPEKLDCKIYYFANSFCSFLGHYKVNTCMLPITEYHLLKFENLTRLQYVNDIQFFKRESENRWGDIEILVKSTIGRILPPGYEPPECYCLIALNRHQEYKNIWKFYNTSAGISQNILPNDPKTAPGVNKVVGLVGKTLDCCNATVPIYEHMKPYKTETGTYSIYDYNLTSTEAALWTTNENPVFYIWPAA